MDKRLLFLTPGLGKGGAETQLLKIAQFCKAQKFEVMIIALRPIYNFSETLDESGIKIVFLKEWKSNKISNILLLYNTFKTFKPQVVIAFMFIAIIFARLLKFRFQFKLISSVRNSVISRKWHHIFKMTKIYDDLVVYNAHASKLNFEKSNLVRNTGMVINNAITIPLPEKFSPKINKQFVWISMAHFRPSKDYHTLFEAIPLIKNRDFRIDILGHLNKLDWPQQKIKDLKIEDKVRILGFQSNSQDYLQQADALVLSSFNEGMPNAILEAMAYSKPIVGSDIDGIRELITDCDCGMLFKQGNPQDLAEKMDKIMEMTELQRNVLSSKGREHIIKYFSEEVILEKWLAVIKTFFVDKSVTY